MDSNRNSIWDHSHRALRKERKKKTTCDVEDETTGAGDEAARRRRRREYLDRPIRWVLRGWVSL